MLILWVQRPVKFRAISASIYLTLCDSVAQFLLVHQYMASVYTTTDPRNLYFTGKVLHATQCYVARKHTWSGGGGTFNLSVEKTR